MSKWVRAAAFFLVLGVDLWAVPFVLPDQHVVDVRRAISDRSIYRLTLVYTHRARFPEHPGYSLFQTQAIPEFYSHPVRVKLLAAPQQEALEHINSHSQQVIRDWPIANNSRSLPFVIRIGNNAKLLVFRVPRGESADVWMSDALDETQIHFLWKSAGDEVWSDTTLAKLALPGRVIWTSKSLPEAVHEWFNSEDARNLRLEQVSSEPDLVFWGRALGAARRGMTIEEVYRLAGTLNERKHPLRRSVLRPEDAVSLLQRNQVEFELLKSMGPGDLVRYCEANPFRVGDLLKIVDPVELKAIPVMLLRLILAGASDRNLRQIALGKLAEMYRAGLVKEAKFLEALALDSDTLPPIDVLDRALLMVEFPEFSERPSMLKLRQRLHALFDPDTEQLLQQELVQVRTELPCPVVLSAPPLNSSP